MITPVRIDLLVQDAKRHEEHLHLFIKNQGGDPNLPPPPDLVGVYQRLIATRAMRSHLEHALWEAQAYSYAWSEDFTGSGDAHLVIDQCRLEPAPENT